MEISISDANHADVHAQNDRSCLGPIETCYSGTEVAVLHAKTTGGILEPQRLVILVLKSLFCLHKTTGEGCKQYSLFILMLITMFFMHKTTGDVLDP